MGGALFRAQEMCHSNQKKHTILNLRSSLDLLMMVQGGAFYVANEACFQGEAIKEGSVRICVECRRDVFGSNDRRIGSGYAVTGDGAGSGISG